MSAATLIAGECVLLGAGIVLWIIALRKGEVRRWLDAPSRLPPWAISTSDFMLFVLLVIVLMTIGPVAAMRIFGGDPAGPLTVRDTLVQGFGFQLSGLAACLLFRIHPSGKPPQGPGVLVPSIGAGLRAFVHVLPVMAATMVASYLALEASGLAPQPQDIIDTFRQAGSPMQLAALVFLAVGIAPLTEELIFRAGVFQFLATRIPTGWAMGISSALFAALHQNTLTFVPLVLLGCVLSGLYQKTGRLAAPVALHAVFNLNSVLIILYGPEG